MAERTVLVCGATGFIGRNVTEALLQDPRYRVVATWHRTEPWSAPGLTWVRVDLCDAEQVRRVVQGVDVIVQMAATTSGSKDIVTRPHIHVTDNAVMNSLLFRAAHDAGVEHVVFPSCTVMYPSSETPLREEDFDAGRPLHPRYFGVGWTKVYLERVCEFFAGLGRTRFTVLRHSNVYGPHDKYDLERSHVFGATMTKVLRASDGRVVVWGTGVEERDLIYVSDVVGFVQRALQGQQTPFGLYNVGSGTSVSIRDLVHRVVAASGRDLRIEYDTSKPSIKTSLCLDCGRAWRELGWRPEVDLDEGIRRTMAWYRDNLLTEGGA